MEERAITPAESLRIIENMLAQTRNRFYNNGFAFLLWGWLIILACLAAYGANIWEHSDLEGWIWIISIVAGIIVTIIYYGWFANKNRKFTRLDSINGQVWIGYGISYAVLAFMAGVSHFFMPPFIFCLLGMGMFATGGIYKFWSIYAGAVVFWIGAILCTLLPHNINQYLLSAAIMFLGYLVPGYILWLKAKKEAHV